MNPVLFYGVPQGCSFGSIVALEWSGVPYELSRIEMLVHPWPATFLKKLNPLGLTPSFLTEDNRVINESLAVLLHLASRQGHLLGYPQGSAGHDRLNQALAYLNTEFFWSFNPLWTAFEMEADPPRQEMLRQLGRARVAKACAYLDGLLSGREWMDGGAKRTVADAYFAGLARWAEYHRVLDVQAYPNLHRHLQKLRADPAVSFADAIERQQLATTTGRFVRHVALDELESRL